jgi:hypothetical protein
MIGLKLPIPKNFQDKELSTNHGKQISQVGNDLKQAFDGRYA